MTSGLTIWLLLSLAYALGWATCGLLRTRKEEAHE